MSTGLRAGTNNDGYLQVNGTDVLTALSSGRIGIGTTGPARKVEIVDTAATVLQLNSTSSDGTSLRILHSGNDKMYMGLAGDFIIGQANNVTDSAIRSNGSLLFASGGGTERLRITSTGLVGIDVTSPATNLDVNGSLQLRASGNTTYATRIYSLLDSTHCSVIESYLNNSTAFEMVGTYADGGGVNPRIVIGSGGQKVGINTTNPQAQLHVDGTIHQTGIEYPTIRPTLDLNFAATKTLDRRITFTRDSIGTYYGDDGLLKYATNNVPRFDHDPDTRESLGLLIEESSTNIISGAGGYGSDIRNGSNLGNAPTSSVVDGITLPDGTVGQVRRLQIHPSGNSGMRWGSTSGGNANTAYSASVWARATSGTATAIIDVNDLGNNSYNLTEEWVRMTVTGTRADAYQFMDVMGSAGHDFYLWGFQIENKGFVSSYIPVASNESNKTRAADIAKITGTNLTYFYNNNEGTVFAEYQNLKTGDTNGRVWDIGNNLNQTFIINAASSTTVQGQFYNSSGNGYEYNPGAVSTTNEFNKVALGMKNNDTNFCVNGTLGTDDTSITLIDFSSSGTFSIGRSEHYSPRELNGCVRRLSYYNKRLSNAQLQGLTQQ